MRETRLSGSEGGAGQLNAPSLPLSPGPVGLAGGEGEGIPRSVAATDSGQVDRSPSIKTKSPRLDVAGARRPGGGYENLFLGAIRSRPRCGRAARVGRSDGTGRGDAPQLVRP
jgi:hypothetical protein